MYGSVDSYTHFYFRQYMEVCGEVPNALLADHPIIRRFVKHNVFSVQATKTYRGTMGAALLILNPGTRWR